MYLDTTILQSRTTITLIKFIERLVKNYGEDTIPPELHEELMQIREELKTAVKKNKQGSISYQQEEKERIANVIHSKER